MHRKRTFVLVALRVWGGGVLGSYALLRSGFAPDVLSAATVIFIIVWYFFCPDPAAGYDHTTGNGARSRRQGWGRRSCRPRSVRLTLGPSPKKERGSLPPESLNAPFSSFGEGPGVRRTVRVTLRPA
ncbi:hypothetical protein [Hymenobacter sp. BT190]|uniref:hypothetical protein n=1 Tax=Hymenobacter sp. BT190 TaxID=2763505 RepID=UPI001650E3E6|nr:hypothetical protein [Hymenobacter sp. BT190]MBC6700414.1 hypothetical protein [Hymenobacter sp. BT190]